MPGIPDHPVIRNMEATGYPDGKYPKYPRCPVCGREFLASREYTQKRKYCSRACANKGRAKGRKESSGSE